MKMINFENFYSVATFTKFLRMRG